MRLTHKIRYFHTNFVHIFEAVNYHKKIEEKHSALHTDLVNRHTNFYYFSKCFNPHTKFVDLKFKKNLHTELNLKIEMVCNIYAFITSN